MLQNKKLKTLDLSFNRLTGWGEVERLTDLVNLTNLTLRGNPLPAPPADVDKVFLREDVGADKLTDEAERRYRHYALQLFQKLVGKEHKPKVQLIVLDSIRVKNKWSHKEGGHAHEGEEADEVPPRATVKEKKRPLDETRATTREAPAAADEDKVIPEPAVKRKKKAEVPPEVQLVEPVAAPSLAVESKVERFAREAAAAMDSGVVKIGIPEKKRSKPNERKAAKKAANDVSLDSILQLSSATVAQVGLGGTSAWDT